VQHPLESRNSEDGETDDGVDEEGKAVVCRRKRGESARGVSGKRKGRGHLG
jgi:hypothetical protein